MKIELTCRCGSSVTLEGDHFINGGRGPDGAGRVFIVEVVAAAWLDRHAMCPVFTK